MIALNLEGDMKRTMQHVGVVLHLMHVGNKLSSKACELFVKGTPKSRRRAVGHSLAQNNERQDVVLSLPVHEAAGRRE